MLFGWFAQVSSLSRATTRIAATLAGSAAIGQLPGLGGAHNAQFCVTDLWSLFDVFSGVVNILGRSGGGFSAMHRA
jgi:hypothetical protein